MTDTDGHGQTRTDARAEVMSEREAIYWGEGGKPAKQTDPAPPRPPSKVRWFRLFSSRKIYPLDPDPALIEFVDIACGLPNLCRFSGQIRDFYSVGQHSVYVAEALRALGASDDAVRWGLMHDAPECLGIGDLVSPVKWESPEYRAIEERLAHAVAVRFGLSWPMPAEVDLMDLRVLRTEARELQYDSTREWDLDHIDPMPIPAFRPWSIPHARSAFWRLGADLGLLDDRKVAGLDGVVITAARHEA